MRSTGVIPLLYKPYGRTGTSVSAIAFGGMRFTNHHDLARGADLVRYAHERGINYFDTAPAYCDGHSELIFGQALPKLERSSFVVSTKSANSDGAQLRAELEQSLERLKLDRIDFFHIWCLMSREDWEKRLSGGAVEAAQKAQAEGLIGKLVCSSHMPGEDIQKVLETGIFAGVTLGYNAANFPYRTAAVRRAAELGLGVVAMNPLSGGLIPQNPGRFAFLQRPGDASVVTGALRFLVSDPDVTAALVGFSAETEIDEAVASTEGMNAADPDLAASLRGHVEQSFNQVCTGCSYCLPCPQGIPIPQLMDVSNVQLLGGTKQDIADRFRWHWQLQHDHASDCIDCGDCEPRCTQHLSIRERFRALPKPAPFG